MHPDAASAIRAQLIAAMERRVAGLDGEARRALDARLAALRTQCASADEAPRPSAPLPDAHPLRDLADHLDRAASPARESYPDVRVLVEFRQLWSALRADSQLREAVAQVPTDAGPLNSTALAGRAIALMRELSPGYLRSFLAYVDDLAWLEQVGRAGSGKSAAAPGKRAARKPRT
ncbi:DUF2894 domain-containing protein [Frateuria soli]|uniref:DUF2894 domain-containing protein n=1 Tax=Frateuria soli TaxID=1542730 RepID=UPI001E4C9182|nr:DUF2894 domain-containing protein [Frateuria soli]UGB36839.1 DUF2894 domain-containing protein [Frateuria soli]